MVKNVSGYDMMKLHLGALGSLGVIVAASFKVFPKPLHDVTVEASFGTFDEAWAASEAALTLPMPPAALELFSSGRILARFLGSRDAVVRMTAELGWVEADTSVWVRALPPRARDLGAHRNSATQGQRDAARNAGRSRVVGFARGRRCELVSGRGRQDSRSTLGSRGLARIAGLDGRARRTQGRGRCMGHAAAHSRADAATEDRVRPPSDA